MKVLHGLDAERKNAIERASGAFIWRSNDSTRVFLSGNAAAIARARTALDAVVVPAATISVAEVCHGVAFERAATYVASMIGYSGDGVIDIQNSTGAMIWASKDGARVFVSGADPAAVRRARAVLVVDMIAKSA